MQIVRNKQTFIFPLKSYFNILKQTLINCHDQCHRFTIFSKNVPRFHSAFREFIITINDELDPIRSRKNHRYSSPNTPCAFDSGRSHLAFAAISSSFPFARAKCRSLASKAFHHPHPCTLSSPPRETRFSICERNRFANLIWRRSETAKNQVFLVGRCCGREIRAFSNYEASPSPLLLHP